MIKSGHYPYDPSDPLVKPDQDPYEDVDVLKPYWTPNPPHLSSNGIEIPSFETIEEAKEWESTHNVTMVEILGLPSAAEVGEANEWLSFMLMAVGWLLLLTSIGSYWRVKRFGELRFHCSPSLYVEKLTLFGDCRGWSARRT